MASSIKLQMNKRIANTNKKLCDRHYRKYKRDKINPDKILNDLKSNNKSSATSCNLAPNKETTILDALLLDFF